MQIGALSFPRPEHLPICALLMDRGFLFQGDCWSQTAWVWILAPPRTKAGAL